MWRCAARDEQDRQKIRGQQAGNDGGNGRCNTVACQQAAKQEKSDGRTAGIHETLDACRQSTAVRGNKIGYVALLGCLCHARRDLDGQVGKEEGGKRTCQGKGPERHHQQYDAGADKDVPPNPVAQAIAPLPRHWLHQHAPRQAHKRQQPQGSRRACRRAEVKQVLGQHQAVEPVGQHAERQPEDADTKQQARAPRLRGAWRHFS